MKEFWTQIEDFPKYHISNYGRVKSFNGSDGKILTQGKNTSGYSIITLISCKRKTVLVHRLVAEYFIPNPDNKPEVNHKDSNRENARVDNLEWCTHSENMKHAFLSGRMVGPNIPNPVKGEDHYNSKLNKRSVLDIRKKYNNGVTKEFLSKKHHVSASTIIQVVKRESWKHV